MAKTSSIPNQTNIMEIIKSNVHLISEVSNIIVNGLNGINISINIVKSLNEQLDAIYGNNGIFYKIEAINKRLDKNVNYSKNVIKHRFFKLQLKEIITIINFVKELSEAASTIDEAALNLSIKTIDSANHIISVLDNVKVSVLLPIKIDIMRLSFSRFRRGVLRNVRLMGASMLKSAKSFAAFPVGISMLIPAIVRVIQELNKIDLDEYATGFAKIQIVSKVTAEVKEIVKYISKLNKTVKDLEFSDLAIFYAAISSIAIISKVLQQVDELNLLPTQLIKLRLLNYTLPKLFHVFDYIMNYFNPLYKTDEKSANGRYIRKRKRAWEDEEYLSTIKGITTMSLVFFAFKAIKYTVNIVNMYIFKKLNVWNTFLNGTMKMFEIFDYIMNYFNPLYISDKMDANGIYIWKRKRAWKYEEYLSTIYQMGLMSVIFYLFKHVVKYLMIAALFSVPFSLLAIPFLFTITMIQVILDVIFFMTKKLSLRYVKRMLILVSITAVLAFVGMELFVLSLVAKSVMSNFLWILALLGGVILVVFMIMPLCMVGALLTFIGPFAITGLFSLTAVISALVLVALELRLLQTINLDKTVIMYNVDTVLSVCKYIISSLFSSSDNEHFESIGESKSWLGLIVNIGKGAGDLIKLIAASAMLVLTFISVTLILFTVGILKLMQHEVMQLDKSKILSTIDTVLQISDFIVEAIFGNATYDKIEDRVVKTEKYKNSNFIQRVFRGIGDLITMIAASAMLVSTLVSIGSIMLIVLALREIQDIAFEDSVIRANVQKVIDLAKLVIDSVNKPSPTNVHNKDNGIIGKVLDFVLPSNMKYAIDALLTMPFLAMTWVNIGMIKGIIGGLKELETLPNFGNIQINTNKLLNFCSSVITQINEYDFSLKDIKNNLKIVRNLKRLIRNIVGVGDIETEEKTIENNMYAIGRGIYAFCQNVLKEMQKIPKINSASEKIKSIKDINNILKELIKFANISLVDAKYGLACFTELVDDFIKKTGNNKNITRDGRYEDALENISRYVKIFEVLNHLNNEFVRLSFGDTAKQSAFVDNNIKLLNVIAEIDDSHFKKTSKFYKQLRLLSEHINSKFNVIETVIASLKTIEKSIESLKYMKAILESLCKMTLDYNIDHILEPIKSISHKMTDTYSKLPSTTSIGLLSEKAKLILDSTKNSIDLLNTIATTTINENVLKTVDNLHGKMVYLNEKLNYSIINLPKNSIKTVKAFIKYINTLNDGFKEIADTNSETIEKNINNYVKFIDKVNTVEVKKLETSANMFKQMANFSSSIKGNFEKLAETLAEDLMPILQELKEIMGQVPEKLDTGFQNTSASIAATTYAPTTANVTEQVNRENPKLSKEEVDDIVKTRLNERAKADANSTISKLDELISLLKGYSGDNVIVKTV